MIRRTGSSILLGLLVWGMGTALPAGNPAASEPIADREIEGGRQTVAVNVQHLVAGMDYKGVLEMGRSGIAYLSEYAEWLEFTPWSEVVGWQCFGSRLGQSDEEGLCTLWIQVDKGEPKARGHLFFKVPCDMVPGRENWEIVDTYDPRDRS
jgi:hypothetical protein